MIVKMKKDWEKKWKTFNTEFEPLDIVASTVNTLNNIEGNNGIVLDMSYSFKKDMITYLVSFIDKTDWFTEEELIGVDMEEDKPVGFQTIAITPDITKDAN